MFFSLQSNGLPFSPPSSSFLRPTSFGGSPRSQHWGKKKLLFFVPGGAPSPPIRVPSRKNPLDFLSPPPIEEQGRFSFLHPPGRLFPRARNDLPPFFSLFTENFPCPTPQKGRPCFLSPLFVRKKIQKMILNPPPPKLLL